MCAEGIAARVEPCLTIQLRILDLSAAHVLSVSPMTLLCNGHHDWGGVNKAAL